jgi:hypothetical protein
MSACSSEMPMARGDRVDERRDDVDGLPGDDPGEQLARAGDAFRQAGLAAQAGPRPMRLQVALVLVWLHDSPRFLVVVDVTAARSRNRVIETRLQVKAPCSPPTASARRGRGPTITRRPSSTKRSSTSAPTQV